MAGAMGAESLEVVVGGLGAMPYTSLPFSSTNAATEVDEEAAGAAMGASEV
jgi:hypothetical protein